jgi:transposase-like protein
VILTTSDDHQGLKAALKSVSNGVFWNCCHVHLQRNATAYVPKVAMRSSAARDISNILSAPNCDEVRRLLDLAVEKYRTKAPRLSAWMEEKIPEGFTVFMLPYAMRRRLRTTHMLERINREIKCRPWVASLFPNEASLLRLVSAILMETSQEWETSRKYLTLEYDLRPNLIYRKKVALSMDVSLKVRKCSTWDTIISIGTSVMANILKINKSQLDPMLKYCIVFCKQPCTNQ